MTIWSDTELVTIVSDGCLKSALIVLILSAVRLKICVAIGPSR